MNSKRIKEYLIFITIFMFSSTMLGLGISFCVKLDSCDRPIINGQCSDPSKDCQYQHFGDIVTGSCCPNTTTNEQCLCCKYYNSDAYEGICYAFTIVGGLWWLISTFIIVIYMCSCCISIFKRCYKEETSLP